MKKLREEPLSPCLIKTAFDVHSNPVIAKESTIPVFDANETTTEEECGTVIIVDMSSNASWSVTSDYVRKSCVLFATLSGCKTWNTSHEIWNSFKSFHGKICSEKYGKGTYDYEAP
jgi:hypothetical protein